MIRELSGLQSPGLGDIVEDLSDPIPIAVKRDGHRVNQI
jgi:hypothetical protein